MLDLGGIGEPNTQLRPVCSPAASRMIVHLHDNAGVLWNRKSDVLRQPPRACAGNPAAEQKAVQNIRTGYSGAGGVDDTRNIRSAKAVVPWLAVLTFELLRFADLVKKQEHMVHELRIS